MGKTYIAELATLKKEGRYRNFLVRPIAPEVNINIEGYPFQGPKDAKFVLVEASDYTCGHCKTTHPEVKKVLEKHKGKIKFVQMNFALQPHGLSGKLVAGAWCAQKQGKFWDYHNLAFEHEFDTKDFNAEGIAKVAKLDMKKFKKCTEDKAADDFIHKTNDMLSAVGVNGTPSFFLNNKKLVLRAGLEQAVNEAMGL
jgi:protein-disulfide isomerase